MISHCNGIFARCIAGKLGLAFATSTMTGLAAGNATIAFSVPTGTNFWDALFTGDVQGSVFVMPLNDIPAGDTNYDALPFIAPTYSAFVSGGTGTRSVFSVFAGYRRIICETFLCYAQQYGVVLRLSFESARKIVCTVFAGCVFGLHP